MEQGVRSPMLIRRLLDLVQATEIRRRLARSRGDTERRQLRHVKADHGSTPRPHNDEPGCGD